MVTHVRGHFKNVHGTLVFDPGLPEASRSRLRSTLEASGAGSRIEMPIFAAPTSDVEHFPEITFTSSAVRLMSPNEALVTALSQSEASRSL